MPKPKNKPPIPKFSSSSYAGTVGVPLTVLLSATDPDGSVVRYELNWGDGLKQAGATAPPTSATHTYATAGTKTLRLTVWDNKSASVWTETKALIAAPVPVPPPNPDPAPLPPPTPPGSSPDGTMVPPDSQIVDNQGGIWTLASDASFYVLLNGQLVGGGWQGHQLLKWAGGIYILGLDGNWWFWDGGAGVNVGPVAPNVGVPPPDPTPPPTDPIPPPPTTPSGPRASLASAIYLGMNALPKDAPVDAQFGRGGLTGRVVNGQPHLIMSGAQNAYYPLMELSIPPTWHKTIADAVAAGATERLGVVRGWGTAPYGATPEEVADTWAQQGGNGMDLLCGLGVIDGHQLLYAMAQSYNTTGDPDRQIGLAELDTPGPGQCVKHGPWRTPQGPQKTSAPLFELPQDIADTYFNGRRLGIGAIAFSGAAGVAYGLSLYTVTPPALTLPADDRVDGSKIGLFPTLAARFDAQHRQNLAFLPITPRRKICSWAVPGHCSVTAGVTPAGASQVAVKDTTLYADLGSYTNYGGVPYFYAYMGTNYLFYTGKSAPSGPGFLTGVPASGVGSVGADLPDGMILPLGKYDNGRGAVVFETDGTWGPVPITNPSDVAVYYDYPGAMVYLRTPSGKDALLQLAQLTDTVDGGGVDYGTDTVAHAYYGEKDVCIHGQQAERPSGGPGPKAASTVTYALLYDIADIADVEYGRKALADLRPYEVVKLSTLTGGAIPSPMGYSGTGGVWCDWSTGRLYLAVTGQDHQSVAGLNLPLVHCFQLQ